MKTANTDTRYKRPESVLVVVYTRAGETLLIRRLDRPDFWQSVTGSLRWGESPELAARRELAEETGLRGMPVPTGTVRRFEILPDWSSRYPLDADLNTEHEFRLELSAREDVRLSRGEHDAFEWLGLREAVNRVWSWSNREALLQLVVERDGVMGADSTVSE